MAGVVLDPSFCGLSHGSSAGCSTVDLSGGVQTGTVGDACGLNKVSPSPVLKHFRPWRSSLLLPICMWNWKVYRAQNAGGHVAVQVCFFKFKGAGSRCGDWQGLPAHMVLAGSSAVP